MALADSVELRTVKMCTPQLETALKGLDRELVHFLNLEGFFDEEVAEKILDPVTLWTETEKAGELVKRIKQRLRLDPPSYRVLLEWLKQRGSRYRPILGILEAEFAKLSAHQSPESTDGVVIPEQFAAKYRGVHLPSHLLVSGRPSVSVPLKSCSVRASLNGYVVGLDSTLKYINEDTSPLSVVFRFPVDQSYAIVQLEVVIAGKRILAQLKEKGEAKQDYDDAIARGLTAAFAEEKSGDIFSISLGNLPAKAEAELNLKLVGELPIDAEGAVRFSLPAVLKSQYTPLECADPLARIDSAAHGTAPAVSRFTMMVKKERVARVTSPTHMISDIHDGDYIRITLVGRDAKPLEKDLIILVHRSSVHLPSAVCELGNPSLSQCSYMGAPAVMFSFFPEFESERAACEVLFLVDRSGSMEGSYIQNASETLVLFLKNLPRGCTFNIIGFGSKFMCLFSDAVTNNEENLDVAITHAENLSADLGGTELLGPLQHIFRQPESPNLPRQVFVLTDGAVSNTHACINEVTKNVGSSRVFTFGIGSGASTELVNGLAKAGNGTAEFIGEGEQMQPKVMKSLKRALQPCVTNVDVDFKLTPGFEVLRAPAKIPSIFKGDKIVVYGIFKSKATSNDRELTGTATIKGQISDIPIADSVTFKIPPPTSAGEKVVNSSTEFEMPVVHHLAAKSLLSDWSKGLGWSSTALTPERKQKMIELSIESNIISEHTAFVAYDVDQSQPIEGAMQVWDLTASAAKSQGDTRRHVKQPFPGTYGKQKRRYGLMRIPPTSEDHSMGDYAAVYWKRCSRLSKDRSSSIDNYYSYRKFTSSGSAPHRYVAAPTCPPPTASACPHLEQELDWDHEGEDTDLIEIAHYMLDWEEISTLLGLTDVDVLDIKDRYQGKPDLQRIEALRKWKINQGPRATYGILLEVFEKAGYSRCAEAVRKLLRKKIWLKENVLSEPDPLITGVPKKTIHSPKVPKHA